MRALFFYLSHLLRMRRARRLFNAHYASGSVSQPSEVLQPSETRQPHEATQPSEAPLLRPVSKLLWEYLTGQGGRLSCRRCLWRRPAQLLGEARPCPSCEDHASRIVREGRHEILPLYRRLFRDLRARQVPFMEPKGAPRALAVCLVNTDCDDLAVIGGAALTSFIASWQRLTERGFVVMPYLVEGSVELEEQLQRALCERGRALGFDAVTHLEIISHGWKGNIELQIDYRPLPSLREGGSLLLNACESQESASALSAHNPKLNLFASTTLTCAAEPLLVQTELGPRVREVIYGADFVTPLLIGRRMRRWPALSA